MKKWAKILAGIAVVAAVIWSGLWYAGKGEIEARMDAELAHLAQAGDKVRFATREVGGFPFGYEVTLTDVEVDTGQDLISIRMPSTISRADLSAPDRLVTALPSAFTVTFRPTEEMRAANTVLAEEMLFEVETVAGEIIAAGLPGFNRSLDVVAESLLIVHSQEERNTHLAVEFADMAWETVLPAEPAAGDVRSSGQIGFLDYVFTGRGDADQLVTVESQSNDIQFTGAYDRGAQGQQGTLEELISSMNYLAGETVTRFATESASEGQPGGAVTLTSGTASATLALNAGQLEVRGETRGNRWELLPDDADLPYRGAVDIDIIDMIYRAPFAPSEDMQPFDLKFAMAGFQPEQSVWSIFDAEERLDRSPAEMTVDFEGTMRLTKAQSQLRPGEAPPLEFGNLVVNRIDLSALGATAKAKGNVEFLQPINVPMGRITLRLNQVVEVMTKMVEAQILTPDVLLMGSIISQTYLTEDPESGELIAEIEMGPEGVTVNGKPIGAPAAR